MKKIVFFTACAFWSLMSMAQIQTPDTTTFYPSNGSNVIDVNVLLSWSPSLGGLVTTYECEIDVNPGFTNPSLVTIKGSSARTGELLYGQKYYWRVRAKNSTTTTAWSSAFSFTTFLDQFTGFLPPPGSQNLRNPQLSLRWDSIPGTEDYNVELDTDSMFSAPVSYVVPATKVDTVKGSLTIGLVPQKISFLKFGAKYFWRVKATHSKDASDWSQVNSFIVNPTIEYLNNAQDSLEDLHVKTELKCLYTPGIVEYRFEVDTSLSFSTSSKWYNVYTALAKDFETVTDDGQPTTKPPKVSSGLMAFGKRYYWRIQGMHNGDVSAWANPFTFTTKASPQLQSPVDGAVGVPNKGATFYWKKMLGLTAYDFELSMDPNFSNPTQYTALPDTTSITKRPLDSIHVDVPYSVNKYYWRVRAYHTKDTSAWSSVFSFNNYNTGISGLDNKLGIVMFPNPAEDVVYIDVNGEYNGELRLKLYNVVGEQIDQRNFGLVENKQRIEYDLSTLNSGIYLMNFEIGGEQVTHRLSVK